MESIIEFKSEVLQYADGHRGELSVKLGDIYKTGNVQFSIRVRSEVQDANGHWHEESWGKNERFVENRFEDLLPLLELHGCCFDGAPLRPVAEGSYLLRTGRRAEAIKLLRISDEEADQLLVPANDPQYFSYMLRKLGIIHRWSAQAKKLMLWMELNMENSLLDNEGRPLSEWNFDKSKSDYHNIDKVYETIRDDEAAGEYTEEKIIARKNEQWYALIDKERQNINTCYEREVKKAEIEREIKLSILEAGIVSQNFIIYSDKSVCFNWTYSHPLIPAGDVERFIETIGNERFPDYRFKNDNMGDRTGFMDKNY